MNVCTTVQHAHVLLLQVVEADALHSHGGQLCFACFLSLRDLVIFKVFKNIIAAYYLSTCSFLTTAALSGMLSPPAISTHRRIHADCFHFWFQDGGTNHKTIRAVTSYLFILNNLLTTFHIWEHLISFCSRANITEIYALESTYWVFYFYVLILIWTFIVFFVCVFYYYWNIT